MNEVGKNNAISVEEEFSRLGFDFNSIIEKALYVRNNYAILIETFHLNNNSAQNYHDEVHIEFGVDCTGKREPSSIHNMSVKLMRYGGNAYEGKELDFQYFHRDKGLPTKEQICAKMRKTLRIHEIRNREAGIKHEGIIHAKEIHSKMNGVKQSKGNDRHAKNQEGQRKI